jgi:hypothetical protein
MSHRYVILRHEGVPEPHFDLMIETISAGPLMTWRTLDWPITVETDLTKLGEHRRDYLDYEGPVSNNRGTVKRIAAGACELEWASGHDLLVKFPTQSLHLVCLDDDHWTAAPAG